MQWAEVEQAELLAAIPEERDVHDERAREVAEALRDAQRTVGVLDALGIESLCRESLSELLSRSC